MAKTASSFGYATATVYDKESNSTAAKQAPRPSPTKQNDKPPLTKYYVVTNS